MSLTFLDCVRSMPLMQLPVRATVVPLTDARVLVSPGSTLTGEQLQSAGNVTDIVVTNLFHTEGVIRAAQIHPAARRWGPPGIEKKRPELSWHGILGRDPWPHETELSCIPLDGMPLFAESVLLHHATKTLLVTDLLFNVPDARGLGARIIMGMFGTWHRVATSRAFTLMIRDKAAFRRSLERLFAFDFDRVVPSHGVPVENGKPHLRAALAERGY